MSEIFYEFRYPKGQDHEQGWRFDPIDQVPYIEHNGERVYNESMAVRVYPDGRREVVNGQGVLPDVAALPTVPEPEPAEVVEAEAEEAPEELEIVNKTEPEQ